MANQSIFNAFERMWQHVIAKVGSKADLIHNHDDIYYTEDEVDAAINEISTSKADVDHNHEDVYETKDNAQLKLDQAKSYTDTKTSGLASTSSVTSAVSTHNTSASAHNDIRELITELTNRLNALANSTDEDLDQMAEIVAYIKSNKGLIDSITTSKVNVADIVDNLTTNVSNKPLSAAQGVAIKALIDALEDVVEGKADEEHTHAIADVSGLQSALDGKAASSHGTHVTWTTTSPKANGTAAVGSETKVARGDHVHPTDTTRASKSDFDSHTGNTSNPHSVTKSQVGLGNVENKSSATIRGEITKSNVTTALGYTPYTPTEVDTLLDGKSDTGHAHNYYGVCDTAAATVAKTVTIDGDFELVEGAMVIIKFTNGNSASNPTLNVNGTGAKPMYRYSNTAISTATTSTGWIAGAVQVFVYDGTGWIRDYWSNTTYNNVGLGHGYATCSTAAATVAKVGTLSSYTLTTGGIVAVKFTYAVPASATLNINSKGAKAIYYKGAAITAGVIQAGDTATFIYNGTYYHLLSIDRWQADIDTVKAHASSTHAPSNAQENVIETIKVNGVVVTPSSKAVNIEVSDYEHPSTHPMSMIEGLQTELSGKASSTHKHAATDITSGTLSSSRLPVVPITKGGTGATTAAGAIENLGLSKVLIIESFDAETGTLRTKSYDYTG